MNSKDKLQLFLGVIVIILYYAFLCLMCVGEDLF